MLMEGVNTKDTTVTVSRLFPYSLPILKVYFAFTIPQFIAKHLSSTCQDQDKTEGKQI